MDLITKTFGELTTEELFSIYKLRSAVFVLEQQSPYQDVDDADMKALHMWIQDDGHMLAYLRVLPKGTVLDEVSIGRVIAVQRSKGYGSLIMKKGIETAISRFGADIIKIEAQVQAKSFYEKFGFIQSSEEFIDAGVPHIEMTLHIHI